MGNTPGKEVRPRSSTYSSTPSTFNSYDINRRNTFGNGDYRKTKKQEERDKQREDHYLKLIVKYDESVDGGYLAPFGIYKSNLDFDIEIVRNLIINRKLAPFYTPLQDFDESWTDEELLKILNQLTLHSIEIAYEDENEEDDIDNHKIHKSSNYYKRQEQKLKLKQLIERVKDLQKQEETKFMNLKFGDNASKVDDHDHLSSPDLLLKLYKNPMECPICFLYFPNNLNLSRCCLQPICTECFVQIKRLDPHPPHDQQLDNNELPQTLISEPANCPYCAMNDFGITFDKNIDITTGINGIKPGNYKILSHDAVNQNLEDNKINDDLTVPKPVNQTITGSSMVQHELNEIKQQFKQIHIQEPNEEVILSTPSPSNDSPIKNSSGLNKRRSSIPANSPKVITIDHIRPDWELKLTTAKNKLARKAAAASAIHASNLIINPDTEVAEYDTRRRVNNSNHGSSTGNSTRLQTIEDRMIEEALRLSLLDEQERLRNQNTAKSESSNT